MVAQTPTDRVAAKAAHDQAPIRRRRIRIRAKASFASSGGVAEASSPPAVSQNVAETESAGCEEPAHSNSEDVRPAPTVEVPPPMDEAESPLVDLVSEAEPAQGDPEQVVGLQGLNEVQPKSPAKGVLRRMPLVEILDSPSPEHVKGLVLEDAARDRSKSWESVKTSPFRDPSRVLMPRGVSEAAHECLHGL